MAGWRYVIGPPSPWPGPSRELSQAQSRTLVCRLDGQGEATFQIDGRSDEAKAIVELETDLSVYRDALLMFRGRIVASSDELDENEHRTTFGAVDYRGLLEHRMIGVSGRVFTNTPAGLIAWTLIAESQAITGGNWGITAGLGTASGTLRERTFDPGAYIGKLIGDMGRVENGYEWEVSPELVLNIWHPARGVVVAEPLDFGGAVSRVSYKSDVSKFANVAMAIGSEETTPVVSEIPSIWLDHRGRWEISQGYPSIKEQQTLNDRAPWLRDEKATLRPDITLTLEAGRWRGRTHYWLGDQLPVTVRSGRLNVEGAHRMYEFRISIGDSGDERIQVIPKAVAA
jgi:hypothetical protein